MIETTIETLSGWWFAFVFFLSEWWVAFVSLVEQHDKVLVALSTVVMAVFTIALWFSNRSLWKEAKQASKIARDTADAAKQSVESAERVFLATNRPRIRVKHLWLTYKNDNGPDYPPGEGPSYPTGIDLALVNAGTTTATLREFRIKVAVVRRGGKPPADPRYLGEPIRRGYELASGISLLFENVLSGAPLFKNQEERNAVYNKACDLYCIGDIEYVDALGGFRKTAFCRKLEIPDADVKREAARFVKERRPDPDYEYED